MSRPLASVIGDLDELIRYRIDKELASDTVPYRNKLLAFACLSRVGAKKKEMPS
jgi:hypothetical protein